MASSVIREGDEAQAIQLDEGGVERGQPGVVGLEHLRAHLGGDDKVPDQLLVRLRRDGMLIAGLEELSSQPDSLLDHWKLTKGHAEAESGKYGNIGWRVTGSSQTPAAD